MSLSNVFVHNQREPIKGFSENFKTTSIHSSFSKNRVLVKLA